MKTLVYSNDLLIKNRQEFANQLVSALNLVLTRFKDTHNHFSQPVDEGFAFALVADPVGQFDELLRINSPIKPIGGKPLDLVKVAELTGIDREAFIQDFTVLQPGSVDNYNRAGRQGLLKLSEANRSLVSWNAGAFTVNTQALAAECEAYKVYATEPEQIAEVKFWEELSKNLTLLVERKILDTFAATHFADQVRLVKFTGGKFILHSERLGKLIKSMVPVN